MNNTALWQSTYIMGGYRSPRKVGSLITIDHRPYIVTRSRSGGGSSFRYYIIEYRDLTQEESDSLKPNNGSGDWKFKAA